MDIHDTLIKNNGFDGSYPVAVVQMYPEILLVIRRKKTNLHLLYAIISLLIL